MIAGSSGYAAPGGPRVRVTRDLVEDALRASGYLTAPDLLRARADFERHVGAMVESLSRLQDPRQQAELLLVTLHRKGGLLGRYDPRATTLRDILERRAYNCVSASVLYNLIAHRLSLPVAAQLLPTHARSMLSLEEAGRLTSVVVETTSREGFNPTPEEQAVILASVTPVGEDGGRSLVSERGAIVDTLVLIGTIYVNRASIAQESGALKEAERLFAMGQQLAPDPSMQRVLIDQRAALLSQLAADDIVAGDPDRTSRALRSLRAAVRLSPVSDEVRSTVQHNLRALAERLLGRRADAGDERGVVAVTEQILGMMTDPAGRAAVQAFSMNRLAGLRLKANDVESAIHHLERGLAQPLGKADRPLYKTLRYNLVAALRAGAFRSAKSGAYDVSRRYLDRLERLASDGAARDAVSSDLRRVVHLVGEYRLDRRDYPGAAKVFRDGVRRFPKDATSRHNLIVALEQQSLPLIKKGRCTATKAITDEIHVLDPAASFPTQAKLRCVLNRARLRLSAGDFAEAVRLIRSVDGTEETPSTATVRQNLSVALLRWTAALSRAGRCGEALDRAREAKALPNSRPAAVREALGRCR